MGITGRGLDTTSSRNLLLRSLIFSTRGKEIGIFFFVSGSVQQIGLSPGGGEAASRGYALPA